MIAQDIITQEILIKMNFAGSESDWCNERDPEAKHHDELFSSKDMQSYWHEIDNNELKHDKIKNPKWADYNDYDKVTTSFDRAKNEIWDQARSEIRDYCSR